ncbi:hypothetical protein [Sulfurimonas sp.]|jgi:hypothetical protein|uniref:hypothetical protein n=1 Tax=Sulfurimonas sp. TaxID=2022749 RepID=UPI0025D48D54|nr:hypothetical protein [Sulfurimonas sp.]
MKTFLEQLNDFAAEHTTIPLKQFFLYITVSLWVILIVIALFTPLSLSKVAALLLLYITSMITALLTYANTMIERNNTMDILCKTPSDISNSETTKLSNQNHSFIV